MAAFFKLFSKKSRRALGISIALLVVAVTVFVLNISPLFAWFLKGGRYNSTGVDAVVTGSRYELIAERTSMYDNTVDYPGVATTGGLKDRLAAVGYNLTHTSTENAPEIAFELVNEFAYDGLYNMMPGAYGTLTFYVKPLYNDLQLDLRLQIGGYHTVYTDGDFSLEPVTSQTVLDLMRGHLLFFEGRTGADYEHFKYTGLIDDGVFRFDTDGRVKSSKPGFTDCYEVKLYWEWPSTYHDIANNINEENGTTEKYPYELSDYVAHNRNYFFASNANSSDLQELSNGYDDGDQNIGDNVQYIVVGVSENN